MASSVTSSQPETGYSEAEEGSSIKAGDSEESRAHVADEFDGVYTETSIPEITAQTRTDDLKSSEVNADILGSYDNEEKELSSELQSTTNLPSASNNKSSHGKPVSTAAGSSVRRHSTLEDPNFVENYFKVTLYTNIVKPVYVHRFWYLLQGIQLCNNLWLRYIVLSGGTKRVSVSTYITWMHSITAKQTLKILFPYLILLLQNSRLHFIGTWRNRYRKRFHGSFNGLKWADSGQSTAENAKKSTIIHIDLVISTLLAVFCILGLRLFGSRFQLLHSNYLNL